MVIDHVAMLVPDAACAAEDFRRRYRLGVRIGTPAGDLLSAEEVGRDAAVLTEGRSSS